MKKLIAIILVLMMVISLTACSGKPSTTTTTQTTTETTTTQTSTEKTDYSKLSKSYVTSFATGAQGGAFYNVGAGIASVVTEHVEGLTVGAETSGGTTENLNLVGQKEAEFGFAAADIARDAYASTNTFEGKGYDNLRFVMATYSQPYQVIVLADSPIQCLDDLKGRKISVGPEGAPFTLTNFLKDAKGFVKGVDYEGQYLSHSQAATALGDGTIEAMVISVGVPVSAVAELATTKPIRLINLTEEELTNLKNASPMYVPRVIAAGTYTGVDYDVNTVEMPVLIVTNSDTPAEVVYQFIKATLENTDTLVAMNATAKAITPENSVNAIVLPLHEGAEAYFRDAGLIK